MRNGIIFIVAKRSIYAGCNVLPPLRNLTLEVSFLCIIEHRYQTISENVIALIGTLQSPNAAFELKYNDIFCAIALFLFH
jgi:hypothetical protein